MDYNLDLWRGSIQMKKHARCIRKVATMKIQTQKGLLLLAAPTWLWVRCGRHNSPPASSVMDLVFRRSDGSYVSVDTVHPSLLRSSSPSSPRWYHLQSLSSCRCRLRLASLRGQTTRVALSCTSLRYSLTSVSP